MSTIWSTAYRPSCCTAFQTLYTEGNLHSHQITNRKQFLLIIESVPTHVLTNYLVLDLFYQHQEQKPCWIHLPNLNCSAKYRRIFYLHLTEEWDSDQHSSQAVLNWIASHSGHMKIADLLKCENMQFPLKAIKISGRAKIRTKKFFCSQPQTQVSAKCCLLRKMLRELLGWCWLLACIELLRCRFSSS